ncbi:ubiquitin carboxyl-terminal hydrolase [Nitzschia inconspicua]|uniref:ubiquitinyl hydrolase 1 n=1 Tax=Nitzschia inconspicua TaxID=303405 RepID=A0A9K3KU82_9STRA|nr:ubiquitin carboxyl-terminal hydrolase [Nitzschia inconspicua]
MAIPSLNNNIASLTNGVSATTSTATTNKTSADFDAQVQELSSPPPESFTLVSSLQLLDPLDTKTSVFLMTRSYLQNWLLWAYHQQVSKSETSRVDAALKLAAERYGLTAPQEALQNHLDYADPGPMDASFLSLEGHDLLLSPNVIVKEGNVIKQSTQPRQDKLDAEFPELLRRVKSLPMEDDKKQMDSTGGDIVVDDRTKGGSTVATHEEDPLDSMDVEGDAILCCAVPARFYETLRSVLGVVCDDGFSVSYQPFVSESPALIHYHTFPTSEGHSTNSNDENQRDAIETAPEQLNGIHKAPSDDSNNGHEILLGRRSRRIQPRPIEFQRRIIMQPAAPKVKYGRGLMDDAASPMTKLLKEQERLAPPRLVPTVELYPIKLNYKIIDPSHNFKSGTEQRGFVLVSRRTRVFDALHDLLKVTAPQASSTCKRVWSCRERGTKIGDGFEVIDLASLDGKLNKKADSNDDSVSKSSPAVPSLLVGEWIRTHYASPDQDAELKELEVLVEIRRPNMPWPREDLELENRLQVGDFVDAQDIAGKWYEAIVREVDENTVSVHYFGWASRWNSKLRRKRDSIVESVNPRLNPPAPLWTHSKRWRERLADGNVVEVRDSLSTADRPKWYKGIVKTVGNPSGPLRKIEGGAKVETYGEIIGISTKDSSAEADQCEDDVALKATAEERNKPLLLLNREQQVLVEIEQERQNQPTHIIGGGSGDTTDSDSLTVDKWKARPPMLRWINLYGEEICEAGTHMKIEADGDLTVVTLRYEYEAGRKPVEIMKSWNGLYGQGLVKEAMRGTPPAPGAVGMHNLGNSCFLNSIIQCLNHIEPLTQYFLGGEFAKELNTKNPLGSGGRVATAYATLLKEIWSGDYSALAPRLLKQTVASFAPQFNNSFQHDSQEFCQFLMDGLHEDCNRVISKPYVEELEGYGMEDRKAAIETWKNHLLRHDSIIVDRCQGMHRSHLTCPSCGRESIKFEVYSTISLPLVLEDKGLNKAMQVEDCIEKFLEGEQLDELNAWYCPSCKKHVCALKMIALWSVPDILILHLKRFQFENCSVSNNLLRSKIDETVKFPVDGLDLRKHVLGPVDEDAPPVYNLFGVSEHVGRTANSGHYTATVRNSKDGRWYRYNDAHVGETTGDAAVTGGAYLLFYQRAKGSTRWAGMEKVIEEGEIERDAEGFMAVKAKKKKKKP